MIRMDIVVVVVVVGGQRRVLVGCRSGCPPTSGIGARNAAIARHLCVSERCFHWWRMMMMMMIILVMIISDVAAAVVRESIIEKHGRCGRSGCTIGIDRL